MIEHDLRSTTTSTDASAREAVVDRIVASRGFQRAARLRELLVYITTHADSPEALSEQQIGIRVFGRPESYSPGDDNIVRATARQLRAKLKEYYESEGAEERLILDIPKGGYQPVFLERAGVTETPEAPPPRHHILWIALTALFAMSTLWLVFQHGSPGESPVEP